MTMPDILLSDLEPFAIGGTRKCFVHPEDANRCIKVLRPDRTPEARRAIASGWRRYKRLRDFDDQWKERKVYEYLLRVGTQSWRHVPEYFGRVQTDQGLGIVTALFRDYDGGFPKNLEQLVPSGISESLEKAIIEFKGWLRETLFLSRDLLPHNIIAVADSDHSYQLVIVDGIGNSEFIPISSWFKRSARRKIERKITKFDYRLRILLPE